MGCHKRYLHKKKIKDNELSSQNKLFINKSLRPYCKVTWIKNKKLHGLSKIHNIFFSVDRVKIRISENRSPVSGTHVDDFRNYFLDVDLSPPERSDLLNSSACWVCDTVIVLYTCIMIDHQGSFQL